MSRPNPLLVHQALHTFRTNPTEITQDELETIAAAAQEYPINPVEAAVNLLVMECHGAAFRAGWWTDLSTGKPRDKPMPEALMLMVSELGEAMEGHRKNLNDDHLPQFKMVAVELADCLIRIFDAAGGKGLPIAKALVAKLAYNAQRADHKPEARMAEGGKAY